MEEDLKFKNSTPWTLTTPLFDVFCHHEMRLANVYLCTIFLISSFTRSKDTA